MRPFSRLSGSADEMYGRTRGADTGNQDTYQASLRHVLGYKWMVSSGGPRKRRAKTIFFHKYDVS